MNKYYLDETNEKKLKPAICALIQREDKILMIKRAKDDLGAGFWTPVTGAVDADESIFDAVIREVTEEVKLEIVPVKELWKCLTSNHDYLLHWWLVRWVSGEVVPKPSEVEEFCWLNVAEILKLSPMFEDTAYFFKNIWSEK